MLQHDRKGENENLLLASKDKTIYRLELQDKSVTPVLKAIKLQGPFFATPWCESNRIIVVDTNGLLQILSCETDKVLAEFKLSGDVFSSPVCHNNFIAVGCRDNNLYVLKIIST